MLTLSLDTSKEQQTLDSSSDIIVAFDEAKCLAQKLALNTPSADDGLVDVVDTEWGYDVIIYKPKKKPRLFARITVTL